MPGLRANVGRSGLGLGVGVRPRPRFPRRVGVGIGDGRRGHRDELDVPEHPVGRLVAVADSGPAVRQEPDEVRGASRLEQGPEPLRAMRASMAPTRRRATCCASPRDLEIQRLRKALETALAQLAATRAELVALP
ncbi:MAG: hypothetical protein JXB39_09815 [Deltaproteobacteria bacterium]|nr:hypothetical protein [Deltaproteobacteria bacterium]